MAVLNKQQGSTQTSATLQQKSFRLRGGNTCRSLRMPKLYDLSLSLHTSCPLLFHLLFPLLLFFLSPLREWAAERKKRKGTKRRDGNKDLDRTRSSRRKQIQFSVTSIELLCKDVKTHFTHRLLKKILKWKACYTITSWSYIWHISCHLQSFFSHIY